MISAKSASLLAGVFQQAALVLIIRYSKTRHQDQELHVPYLTSVAVMSAEVFKLCLSYVLEVITASTSNTQSSAHDATARIDASQSSTNTEEAIISIASPSRNATKRVDASQSMTTTGATRRSWSTLKRMLSLNRESIKLIIPAALYLLQNNLLFVALSHLSVPTYQISNQGKLLTTAIISRVLLKKHISAMQYCAIALLGLGVAVVQLSEHHINVSLQSKADSSGGTDGQQNQWLGLLAVFVSCFTSGFAGVYFEFVLKSTKQSVHCRNFQLAFWSCLFAIIHIVSKDMSQVETHGLFHGFDGIVILVVVAQAMTGFVVSMMLKYADALLKGFAISVAVIVASVASIFLFDTKVNGIFFVGASMVGIAVKMYSYYGAGKEEHLDKRRACTTKLSPRSMMLFCLGLAFALSFQNIIRQTHPSTKESVYEYTTSESPPKYDKITSPSPANVTASHDLPAANVTGSHELPEDKGLFFTCAATDETFRIPTDMHYLAKWGGLAQFSKSKGSKVSYMRKAADVTARGKLGDCAPTLDLLAWLMGKVNAKNGTLMIAYGELIHIHREKDFVNKTTGKYIDDDIDTWASLETVLHLGRLEPELFSRFGWTVRAFVNADKYVVFMQMMASCGHRVENRPAKVQSSQPAVEIYPLPVVPVDGARMAKDLWQGDMFPEAMVYPPQRIHFNSSGTSHLLQLQLPREVLSIMECLYGNWTIPSKRHAGTNKIC